MTLKSTKLVNLVQDTKANLEATTKVLPSGIVLHEVDTNKIKISNGTDTYTNLPYSGGEELGDHSSVEPKFGIGTTEKYGHVKVASTKSFESAISDISTDDYRITVCHILNMTIDTDLYIGLTEDPERLLFYSAIVNKGQDPDTVQWTLMGTRAYDDIYNIYFNNSFKVNNYYVFTLDLLVFYSTDGITWNSFDYREFVTDDLLPDGTEGIYNFILRVAYCQKDDTYWIGTMTGVITVNSNFEFINYISTTEVSSGIFDIRDYVVIGDKFVALTTNFIID